jgi:chemotaxis response regulator CheB
MKATWTIRYEGSPDQLALLVQTLQRKRVKVEWTPPPGLAAGPTAPRLGDITWSTDIQQVVATMIAAGGLASINKAVTKFRKKFPHAKVIVQMDTDQGKRGGEQAPSTQG